MADRFSPRICPVDKSEVTDIRRRPPGVMYTRERSGCSTCEFRDIQLPLLERARAAERRR